VPDEPTTSTDSNEPGSQEPPRAPRAPEEEATRDLVQRINRLVPGTLTFHFPQRDISFDMVGADAARILTAHRRGRADDLADAVDPDTSLMLLDWMSVALETTLMISWTAGPDASKVVSAGLAEQDRRAES
jgi:hypothetical protein